MDGLHWAGLLAGAAADALRMVGILHWVYLHLAGFLAGAAGDAGFFVYPVTEHGYRVKDRINSPQRAYVFAERTINND